MQESGYKDFVFATDMVLLAPAKTPPADVTWLEREALEVLATPEMKDKLFQSGFLVRPKSAQAAWARLTKEIATFKQIIDQAGNQKAVRSGLAPHFGFSDAFWVESLLSADRNGIAGAPWRAFESLRDSP